MAEAAAAAVDQRTGFCAASKTFRSLRPAVSLPPDAFPLSFTAYAFSLLPSPLPSRAALVDSATGADISYADLVARVNNIAYAMRDHVGLSKGHVAFILAPSCLEIPVLYLSLLYVGAVISAANPISTPPEISRLVQLTNPRVVFATSSTAAKLPDGLDVILLDSARFQSFVMCSAPAGLEAAAAAVLQSDTAAIQFSSGTTGRVKAAAVPHRSFIAQAAGFHVLRTEAQRRQPDVTVLAAPMFHSLGFFFVLKGVALGETTVVMTEGRPGMAELLGPAEQYRATQMTASPPVVAAMARNGDALRYDLSALERLFCGGAPLAEETAVRFRARFPAVDLSQGYGSTEAGGIARLIGYEECRCLRSVGRLSENVEAKIIDNETRKALSVGQQGELWVRGPALMTGYIGDREANASTFDRDGWLKTGDLCYFDQDGYLYIVDRLKELIKYKAYQVAPAELEELLQSLPQVVDAAVIPYPHEEAGQIPMACVVRQPGSNINEAQVIDFVANQVAPYKKIRKVEFIKSIPKSAAGKILRRELVSQVCRCSASRL